MTTLLDRIAGAIESTPSGTQGLWSLVAAERVLALFRDESPPSDEVFADRALDWYDKLGSPTPDELANILRDEHARGIASGEAERAELQRRLEDSLAIIEVMGDRAGSEVEIWRTQSARADMAERERDAAQEELREVGEALAWACSNEQTLYFGKGGALNFENGGASSGDIAGLLAARKAGATNG